jgi:hypothetical protein
MTQATITVQGNTYKTIDINDDGSYDMGTVNLLVYKDIRNSVLTVDDTQPLTITIQPLTDTTS